MEWKDYAEQIKDLLKLDGSPVAITYSMYPPSKKDKGKFRVCNAFLDASHGKIIDLTAETSACGGGTWHLGLGEKFKGEAAKALKETGQLVLRIMSSDLKLQVGNLLLQL